MTAPESSKNKPNCRRVYLDTPHNTASTSKINLSLNCAASYPVIRSAADPSSCAKLCWLHTLVSTSHDSRHIPASLGPKQLLRPRSVAGLGTLPPCLPDLVMSFINRDGTGLSVNESAIADFFSTVSGNPAASIPAEDRLAYILAVRDCSDWHWSDQLHMLAHSKERDLHERTLDPRLSY